MVFLTNFLEIRGHSLLVKEMLAQLKESSGLSGDPNDRESGLQALLHRETSKVCVCVSYTHARMHTNYS